MPPEDDETTAPTPPTTTTTPPAPPPAGPPKRPTTEPVETDAERETREFGAYSDIRQRERRKFMRETYGTDDPEEVERIKAKRAETDAARVKEQEELTTLRKEREERDRAKMSEVERLTTDLNAEKEKVKDLQAQLDRTKHEVLTERQSSLIQQSAARHGVKPKPSILRVVLADYGTAYLALTNAEKARLKDRPTAERHLERFMKKWAAENADMCVPDTAPKKKTVEDTTATTPRQPVVPTRRPLGAPPLRTQTPPARTATTPLRPGVDENGKTVKPGQPNSMNQAELAAYMRKNKLRAG